MRRFWWMVIAVVVLAAAGAGYEVYTRAPATNLTQLGGHPTKPAGPQQPPDTLLLMGIDQRPGWTIKESRTDVMIVLHVDARTGRLSLLSMPRDTQVDLGKYGKQKLNAAFPYGGPDLAMATVGSIIHQPIHYYAYTTFNGLVDIVNALGGVTVDVPQNMYYRASDVSINLRAGRQHLDGTQVLELVRFREFALGDIRREKDQEMVLRSLFEEARGAGTILRLPVLLPTLYRETTTNLTLSQVTAFGNDLRKAKSMSNAVLPGAFLNQNGLSYWYVDPTDAPLYWRKLLAGEEPKSVFDPAAQAEVQDMASATTK